VRRAQATRRTTINSLYILRRYIGFLGGGNKFCGRQEAYQIAHYLTKYVISISSDVVWIEETSSSCIDAVMTFNLMPLD
jgi:hypothetical protein